MKRNNLVVGHMRMFLVLKAELLHRCANADLRTMSALYGRIFPLDDLQHLRAVHRLHDLVFICSNIAAKVCGKRILKRPREG